MNLLARREHSRYELANKVSGRVESPTLLGEVLDELETDNLLNDKRFCESFVRYRINGGHGPNRIKADLRQRRVDISLVEQFLPMDMSAYKEQLGSLALRKLDGADINEWKLRAKIQRFLMQRGYTNDQINWVVRNLAETSDLTNFE